jgi:hypothetical protein
MSLAVSPSSSTATEVSPFPSVNAPRRLDPASQWRLIS